MSHSPRFQYLRYIKWEDLKEFLTANLQGKDCLAPYFHHGAPRGADYAFMGLVRAAGFAYLNGLSRIEFSGLGRWEKEKYEPLLTFLTKHFGDTFVLASELSDDELWSYGFQTPWCDGD